MKYNKYKLIVDIYNKHLFTFILKLVDFILVNFNFRRCSDWFIFPSKSWGRNATFNGVVAGVSFLPSLPPVPSPPNPRKPATQANLTQSLRFKIVLDLTLTIKFAGSYLSCIHSSHNSLRIS